MWSRSLFLLVLALVVAANPYSAAIIYRLLETTTVTFQEHDGTTRSMISGPDAPRPDWLAMLISLA